MGKSGKTILICSCGTYPGQLMYQELSDMACERITAALTLAHIGDRPIKVMLAPCTSNGSTQHVNFNISKRHRWQTDARRCHVVRDVAVTEIPFLNLVVQASCLHGQAGCLS